MKILCMCYPVWAKVDLHLNSTSDFIVLPTDGIIDSLVKNGVEVDVLNLYPNSKYKDLPLMVSKMKMKTIDEIQNTGYDLYIHMFKDPTQPEVLEIMKGFKFDYGSKKVLNEVVSFRDFHKHKYMPILHEFGIGPKVIRDKNIGSIQWNIPTYSAHVSKDLKYALTSAINNNRGDYPGRFQNENIIVEFMNNAKGGIRSFFRVGYCLGRCTSGWLYCSEESMLVQKSGMCKHKIPYQIPNKYHDVIRKAFVKIGVDYCHFEGCFIDGEIYVFDINPHPTSHGGTLSGITEEMVNTIMDYVNGKITDIV